ncbi:MAG TPA: TAXI family TRAP transporter solute-binding subunit [Burkholderiales bacterium]|nr:TAXI family TRAP transporter solute-binding subunit [Burkholderiales bacterium]
MAKQVKPAKARSIRLPGRLATSSRRELFAVFAPVVLILALGLWLAFRLVQPAPGNTIVMLSGPKESSYYTLAERYAKIIARSGVKVQIVETDGAKDNLLRLANPKVRADVGFVLGGLTDGVKIDDLMSLGSVFVQPMLVFYRGKEPVEYLIQLAGKRIAIGPEGSGTRTIAMKFLAANGMDKPADNLLGMEGEEAVAALKDGKIDAAFLMGELVRGPMMRELLKVPGIRLMSFKQGDGYVRRLKFLSRLTLPEGGFDLGLNLPPQETELVGPTVELIARDDLDAALSDLLISAAQEIHRPAGMYRKAGEFPAPLERDFPISEDAQRFYRSGTPFLYKKLPFWLASLVDRFVVVLVPLIVVMIPAFRLLPAIYRWRMRSRIYKWYGALMAIERDMLADPSGADQAKIRKRLEDIQEAVNNLRTPLAYADQLYVLRDHIASVQAKLVDQT